MGLFFAFFLILFFLTPCSLPIFLAKLSQPAHKFCVESAPEGIHRALYQAIVCGSSLKNDSFVFDLKITGLLHLMVVSGSHLIFLEMLLRLILRKNFLVDMGLLYFCFVSGFQAPVVRSLVQLLLNRGNSYFHWQWTGFQRVLISGLLCWALFPDWIQSYSFLLSWGAGLALALSTGMGSLAKHILIYLFLFCFLGPFGMAHPASIVMNWIMGPLVGSLLFPLSLMAFLFPASVPITDLFWNVFLEILKTVSPFLTTDNVSLDFSLLHLWILLWSAQFASHFFLQFRERASWS